jgi:4-alpha-glucanotransferase
MVPAGNGPAGGDTIDYQMVVPQRVDALRRAFRSMNDEEDRSFETWRDNAPPWLAGFAEWEAASFAGSKTPSPTDVRFHEWLQFRAERELMACAVAAQRGKATGLIRDLPVGPAQDGYETTSQRPYFARDVDVGAPPDRLAPKGQNWGIAGLNPIALEEGGYAPFIALLRANMRHTGGLRIDHVMSLLRLFWIPRGRESGGYVRYPFEDLVALCCLESVRAGCVVIGEDLGTVPSGFREKLRRRGILGTKVALFERRSDGRFVAPSRYPYASLATVSTHDMPTFRRWWREASSRDRQGLAQALQKSVKLQLPRRPPFGFRQNFIRLAALIARAGSALSLVRIEDVALEARSINIPGTGDEYLNWSLRLRCTLKTLLDQSPARVWRVIVKTMQSLR